MLPGFKITELPARKLVTLYQPEGHQWLGPSRKTLVKALETPGRCLSRDQTLDIYTLTVYSCTANKRIHCIINYQSLCE